MAKKKIRALFHTAQSDLKKYDGTEVTVGEALTDAERDPEVGEMFHVTFADGYEHDAFMDELTFIDVLPFVWKTGPARWQMEKALKENKIPYRNGPWGELMADLGHTGKYVKTDYSHISGNVYQIVSWETISLIVSKDPIETDGDKATVALDALAGSFTNEADLEAHRNEAVQAAAPRLGIGPDDEVYAYELKEVAFA